MSLSTSHSPSNTNAVNKGSKRFKRFKNLFSKKTNNTSSTRTATSSSVALGGESEMKRLAWYPEDIIDEMNGMTCPPKLIGKKMLIQVGGVGRGWILDFSSDDDSNNSSGKKIIVVRRYDIPKAYINVKKSPNGPPPSISELKSCSWIWYRNEEIFSKIESGKLNDMKAFVMGKIGASGDMKAWDYIDDSWKKAKEIASERKKNLLLMNGDGRGLGGGIVDIDEEEEDDVDEEARIIAMVRRKYMFPILIIYMCSVCYVHLLAFLFTLLFYYFYCNCIVLFMLHTKKYKPEVEPTDPRTKAFWKRHIGTDFLLCTYLWMISSIVYVAISINALFTELAKAKTSIVDPSIIAHSIGNLFSAIFFLIGNAYFIKLSYPEEMMIMAYRVMTVDPSTMTFIQRYFTASEFLFTLWMFNFAFLLPVLLEVVFEILFLHEWHHALNDIVTMIVSLLFLGPLMISSFPDAMRQNNGLGSSYFYDYVVSVMLGLNKEVDAADSKQLKEQEDLIEFWKTHLGTDMLVGSWLFAVIGFFGLIPVIVLAVTHPFAKQTYVFFVAFFNQFFLIIF